MEQYYLFQTLIKILKFYIELFHIYLMLLSNLLVWQNEKFYEFKVIETIFIILSFVIINSIILCSVSMYNINTFSLNYEINEESFIGIIITQCILIKQIEEGESFTKVYIFKDNFEYYSNMELVKIMEIKVKESITFYNHNLRSKNELKHNNFPFKDFYLLSTINHKPFRKRKRSKLEISAEIIEYLQSDFLDLNEIAFYTELNYKTAKKYIEFLLMNELIDSIVIKGKIYYKASSKGIQFIKYFKEINKLFNYKNN